MIALVPLKYPGSRPYWYNKSVPYDDVIKWKHFQHCWPFVQVIHRSPVNSPHKGQWRGALMFSLICVWTIGWVNNRDAGDLRRYRAHHGVTVMKLQYSSQKVWTLFFSENQSNVVYLSLTASHIIHKSYSSVTENLYLGCCVFYTKRQRANTQITNSWGQHGAHLGPVCPRWAHFGPMNFAIRVCT